MIKYNDEYVELFKKFNNVSVKYMYVTYFKDYIYYNVITDVCIDIDFDDMDVMLRGNKEIINEINKKWDIFLEKRKEEILKGNKYLAKEINQRWEFLLEIYGHEIRSSRHGQ